MSKSIAHPLIPSTGKTAAPRRTRVRRGMDLFRDRRDEIQRLGASVFLVPSCSGEQRYTVDIEAGTCECPDRPPAGSSCKHLVSAILYAVKYPEPKAAPLGKPEARCAACGGPSGSISKRTGYPLVGKRGGPLYHVRCQPGTISPQAFGEV